VIRHKLRIGRWLQLPCDTPGAIALPLRRAENILASIRPEYGKGLTSVGHAGKTQITIKPSKVAKDALNAGTKLKVSVAVTFKPVGGSAKTNKKTISVRRK
jgi:hypothetical protein